MYVKKKSFAKKAKFIKKSKKTFEKPKSKSEIQKEKLSEILENSDIDENDKNVMEFDVEGSDNDDLDSINNDNADIENIHIPPSMLEVASDEEDESEDDDDDDDELKSEVHGGKLTLKIIKEWETELMKSTPSAKFIRNAMLAFNAALNSISDEKKKSVYKIENPAVFNASMQLCVLYLYPSMSKYLDINEKSNKNMQKSEKWKKLKNSLRNYFTNVAGILERTTNSYMCMLLLKHLHQMITFISSFTVVSKALVRTLINLWSTSQEDPVRVLSFLCILKITRSQQQVLLNHVLKAMYISYIRNCKFVSPNTLPAINFMRRSLIEVFLLDTKLAYQHAFLYIRQLAIHLRNAIILKKKQCFQAIHNWQYVNSIKIWAEMLGFCEEHTDLKPLVYPLVNLTIGLIKCTPTVQFYPLRFHCIKILIGLSKQSNIYIPILPFIFEVLKGSLFKKSSSGESMKALDFTCILRVSKAQVNNNNFKKEVIEQIFSLSFEYLEHQSASLAYPDLVVPTVMSIKKFIKNNKDSNANRKLKQLLDKIEENAKYIDNERRGVKFALNETQKINAWEANIRSKGTPLSIYYVNWFKTNQIKKKRQASNTAEISEFNIPVIKRKKTDNDKDGIKFNMDDDDSDSDFFGKDDDDDDNDDNINQDEDENVSDEQLGKNKEKKKKITKKNKVVTKKTNKSGKKVKKVETLKDKVGINDEVENLNINDW